MNTLDRYVGKAFLRGFLVVGAVLLSLFSIAALVKETDDLGRGGYGLDDALLQILLTTPRRISELSPVAALLGAILGLGLLAAHREILVIRALGGSAPRVALAVLKTAVPCAVALALLMEFISPPLEKAARERSVLFRSDRPSLSTSRGYWFREGTSFLRVEDVEDQTHLRGLEIYRFDDKGRLVENLRAARATLELEEARWRLEDVRREEFTGLTSQVEHRDTMNWASSLGADELELILQAPETLAPSELFRQVRVRRKRGLAVERYQLVLWKKLARPFEFLAMLLLSFPFMLTVTLAAGLGKRFALGALLGGLVFLLGKASAYLGLLLHLPPQLTALTPLLIVLGLTGILLAAQFPESRTV